MVKDGNDYEGKEDDYTNEKMAKGMTRKKMSSL
jgi:hypothetical protein